jgi:hypothetical protein
LINSIPASQPDYLITPVTLGDGLAPPTITNLAQKTKDTPSNNLGRLRAAYGDRPRANRQSIRFT